MDAVDVGDENARGSGGDSTEDGDVEDNDDGEASEVSGDTSWGDRRQAENLLHLV